MRRSGRYKRKAGTVGLTNEYGEDMQPGDIVHSARTTAPVGYLIANGAAVSRATYGNLFAALGTAYGAGDGVNTFNLPDLRGEFIRGADQGRGVDAGREVGTSQAGQFESHTHIMGGTLIGTVLARPTGSAYTTGGGGPAINGATAVAPLDGGNDLYAATAGAIGARGTETRPRNVALLPLIKY